MDEEPSLCSSVIYKCFCFFLNNSIFNILIDSCNHHQHQVLEYFHLPKISLCQSKVNPCAHLQPQATTDLPCLYRFAYSRKFHTNQILQYESFVSGFYHVSKICLRTISVVAWFSTLFLLITEQHAPTWVSHIVLTDTWITTGFVLS